MFSIKENTHNFIGTLQLCHYCATSADLVCNNTWLVNYQELSIHLLCEMEVLFLQTLPNVVRKQATGKYWPDCVRDLLN